MLSSMKFTYATGTIIVVKGNQIDLYMEYTIRKTKA